MNSGLLVAYSFSKQKHSTKELLDEIDPVILETKELALLQKDKLMALFGKLVPPEIRCKERGPSLEC